MALLLGAVVLSGCPRNPNGAAPAGPLQTDSPAHFRDVLTESGIDFRYEIPGKRPITILQAMPGGCAFLDYNGDGNLDILLISQKIALYRGDGKGHFTDVTREVGLDVPPGPWMGCAVGDIDNDGFDDLYISAYRGGILLHNDGGKRFRDITASSGIAKQPWGSACTFGDYDNDGRLDLYVGNYVDFGPDSVQLCTVKDFKTSCSPTIYPPLKGRLYHNVGGGRFVDVTVSAHADDVSGKVLGAMFLDIDGSGRQSLLLANDEVASDLLQNLGGGKFKNVGEAAGTAYTASGKPFGGMGVDRGDIDNDGKPDIVIGTFSIENKLVLINDGPGIFTDRSEPMGVAQPAMIYLSFGTRLFDMDNDGDLDLIFANGYIADNVDQYEPARKYRENTLVFRNENGQRFTEVSSELGPALRKEIVGRGLATGDYDNDGKVDLLIVDGEGPPLLLHNEMPGSGHSLTVRLVGTRSNRNGYGAVVRVEAGGKRQTRLCHADGSYLSSNDPRVHVGLGDATTAKVSVRWPSGKTQSAAVSTVDQVITLTEPR